MIVVILSAVVEADFLYLLKESGLTKGNLSAHLSRLESVAYVEVTKTYRGKVPLTVYRLTELGTAAFEAYRRQLRAVVERPGNHRTDSPEV